MQNLLFDIGDYYIYITFYYILIILVFYIYWQLNNIERKLNFNNLLYLIIYLIKYITFCFFVQYSPDLLIFIDFILIYLYLMIIYIIYFLIFLEYLYYYYHHLLLY